MRKCQVFWPRATQSSMCSAGSSEGIWLLQATGNEMKRGRNEEEYSHRGGIQDMNCYWRGPRNSYDELEFKRRIRDEYEWTDITEGCKPRISVNGSSMTREICWLSLTGNRPNEFRSVYIFFLGLPSDNYHLSVCSLHSLSAQKWVRVWLRVAPSIIRSLLFPTLFQFVPGSQNFLTSLVSILVCDNQRAPLSCTAILCCASFYPFLPRVCETNEAKLRLQAGWEKKDEMQKCHEKLCTWEE